MRAPLTLWRMIAADLWKVLLITAGALVVAMSFAAAVRPLSDGRLDPVQALRFMSLAALPMLQFALPFAASFAATLSYHRLAAENEAQAAYAGGMGHRSLLAPALGSGLVLGALILALTTEVIPGYLAGMQRLISQDAARFIETSVESGRPLRLPGGLIVHADAVARPPRSPESGAADHLVLTGVIAVKVGPEGRAETEAAAQRAGVWLFPNAGREGESVVVVRLIDASGSMPGVGEGANQAVEFRLALPDAFRDDPRFYTWRGLLRLRERPETIGSVDSRRRDLAGALAALDIERALALAAGADGRIALADPDGQVVVVRAGGLERDGGRWRLTPAKAGQAVELSWRLSGERARLQSAQRAWVRVDAREAGQHVIMLDLEGVATMDAASEAGVAAERTKQSVGPFRLMAYTPAALMEERSEALLARADGLAKPDDRVEAAAAALRHETADLMREILSKEHERLATSVVCVVMALAGAVVALRHGDARPLLVYAWAFLPALLALVTIAGGQSLTHRIGAPGLGLLWGGVAALVAFTAAEYALLRRR